MNFTKVVDSPLSERLAALIRQAIFTGDLASGSKIPQDDLAEEFGVSRMPIREALVILNYEGLVILEPRRGAWVAPLTLATVDESYTMRCWAESAAVKLSVPHLSDEDLRQIQEILTALESAQARNDPEAFVHTNRAFHARIRFRCPWPKLAQLVDTLWNGFPPLTPQFVTNQMSEDYEEHRRLMDAAVARDGQKASAVMTNHITRSWQSAREHFRSLGWPDTELSENLSGGAHAAHRRS